MFLEVQLSTKGELYGLAMSLVQMQQPMFAKDTDALPTPRMPAVWRDEAHFAGAGDSGHLR